MKKIVVLLVMVLLGATSHIAQAADEAAQAKLLMQVLGFDAMLESVRQDTAKMLEGQMDGVMTQLRNAYPNLPESFMKDFKVAAQKLDRRVTSSWNSAEAARIYATTLVAGLPREDMQAAIDHYKTPEGQRELKVIGEAVTKMNAYIAGSIQKETDLAMKDFLEEIRVITERAIKDQE